MSNTVETITNALFQYEYGTHKDPLYERFPEYLQRHREYCAKRARHIAKALEAGSVSDFIPPGVDVEVAREGLQRALLFGTPQDVALAERKVTVALEWQAAADRVTHQAYIADLLAELPTPGGAR